MTFPDHINDYIEIIKISGECEILETDEMIERLMGHINYFMVANRPHFRQCQFAKRDGRPYDEDFYDDFMHVRSIQLSFRK